MTQGEKIYQDHLSTGAIFTTIRDEVVGVAADGCEVQLGTEDDLESVYAYLQANPTPDMW